MKSKRSFLCFVLVFLFALNVQAAIFGADDRTDITPRSSSYQKSRATAIAVLSSLVEKSAPGFVQLFTEPQLGPLCADQKFKTDVTLPWACTGFLVAPDLLVTAGHCMVNTGESKNETELYCKAFSWLFDYNRTNTGPIDHQKIPEQNLYRCKKVIYAIRDEEMPYHDFALVQLDRAAENRKPLVMKKGLPQAGEFLTMIGYPFGMPAKQAAFGQILLNDIKRESYITNLDAFEGNSGSPVFNSNNEVVGMLIGGTPITAEFFDKNQACWRLNACDPKGLRCQIPETKIAALKGHQAIGSEVHRTAPIIQLVEEYLQRSMLFAEAPPSKD